MHDGTIVHDEPTKLGEVAATARRIMYSVPEATEDDDLAGVSTLMEALPDKASEKPRRSAKKRRAGKAKKASRSRRGVRP
jgi:hypothetical protein